MTGKHSSDMTAQKNLDNLQGKYLTFIINNEEYGLEILKVKEIIGTLSITNLPRTPDYVKGVINLRGKVIPIIDLRLRFGMPEKKHDDKTCIIVVEINVQDDNVQLGIVVDSVSEVLNVSLDDLAPTPQLGVELDTDYILAMAKSEDTVRTLLDIDKVLSNENISVIAKSV